MSWLAHVYCAKSGRFLAALRVGGADLLAAEIAAKSKLAFDLRANPALLDVRRLMQLPGARRAAR